MRRARLRFWVVMSYEENGLVVWICEPLRKKEIQKRLEKGWKLYEEPVRKCQNNMGVK